MMLDLRRMMLLNDLAELGTVTAVAARRSITSSAVSQQLRVLEEEAGAALFRRDGRTLRLTRSGEVLAEHVRHVLAAVDEAMTAVAATRDRLSGQIAVAAFNMAVPTLAAPMVRRLSAEEPDLRIEVRQEETGAALRLLRQREIDIAITCHYDFLGDDGFGGMISEILLVEPLVLMAPTETHLRIRKFGLAALADSPWVTGAPHSGLDVAVLRAGERAGFTPQIKHRLLGAQNMCDLAATETASAIVPRLSIPAHLESLIVPDMNLDNRTIRAVVRPGRQKDPGIAAILQTLRSIAASALPAPDSLSAAS
ncbi:LysR family transcriptional regulator [Aldersonia kunmingensis]|uniref:LysR family transcriptional regulator n=1 Tax=Aldersonia kunmingensis TaxID=408066 RepID=UPI000B0BE655|nr:LysR family transcriptional regulator [Aldersonia kunmingensis]